MNRNIDTTELNFISLLIILWRYKYIILLGSFVFTILVCVLFSLIPSSYKVTTIIEPGRRPVLDPDGKLVSISYVEPPEGIKESVLGGVYDKRIQQKLAITEMDYPAVIASIPEQTHLVDISIRSKTPEQAVAILEEMVVLIDRDISDKLFLEQHYIKAKIESEQINAKNFRQEAEMDLEMMKVAKQTISRMEEERHKAMTAPSDALAVMLYVNDLYNANVYYSGLAKKYYATKNAAEQSDKTVQTLKYALGKMQSTIVSRPPRVPQISTGPGLLLVTCLSFLFSFFVLCFVCLMRYAFIDYLTKKHPKE